MMWTWLQLLGRWTDPAAVVPAATRAMTSRSAAVAPIAATTAPEFEAAPVGLVRLDTSARIQIANTAFAALLGHSAAQLQGRSLYDFLFPADINRLRDVWQRLLSGADASYRSEVRALHAYGHTPWVGLSLRLQRDVHGRPDFLILALDDISELRREKALAENAEQRFQRLVENLPASVCMLSADLSRVLYINESFEKIWGEPRASVYANPARFLEMVHPEDRPRVEQVYVGQAPNWEITYRVLRADGEIRHVRDAGHGVFDARGTLLYFTNNCIDVTPEMAVREEFRDLNIRLQEANLRLTENARLDSLTGCLNRSALFEEAAKAMQIDTRYGRNSTLIFFDLNQFKEVNDTFGHHIGDRALVAFAEQIRSRLRSTDELGRYGGDEFVALLRETDAEQAAALLATLTAIVVDAGRGHSLILRYSAGVAALNHPDVETVDDWIRIADDQMYHAKSQRGAR
jgi:diguanylate cyclase (GGDEF)-like protein/PAS domain S-box-containing protein